MGADAFWSARFYALAVRKKGHMAEELEKKEAEEKPEEEQPKQEVEDADTVRVSRKTLEHFMQELQGTRKAQSVFDKREQGYKETIQSLQVLSKFNDLPDEDKSGLANLAKFSRSHATAVGKAYGLTNSDTRYLSTLPWDQIEAEAERIAAEGGKGSASDDDLRRQLFGEGQKKGSADVRLPETRGQRAASGSFKTLDAALGYILDPKTPVEKAREVAQQWGIYT